MLLVIITTVVFQICLVIYTHQLMPAFVVFVEYFVILYYFCYHRNQHDQSITESN